MISSATRQGFFMLYSICLVFLGIYFFEMSFFQIFLILGVSGTMFKLADIEDAIRDIR